MNSSFKNRLLELLEEQAAYGALPVPLEVDPALLRSPERLGQALTHRREELRFPAEVGLTGTLASLRSESVPAPVLPVPACPPLEQRWNSLVETRAAAAACALCGIAARRTRSVFGTGAADADLVIVGEAPGEQEDLQGEPFVGPAGQLLDKMLAAIGFARSEVYICNTLKCRPTGNRNPQPEELAACRPFLDHQLQLIRPRLILALGLVASHALLGGTTSLTVMRGIEYQYRGIPLRVTYHPAALLRNEHWKKPAWQDLKTLRQRYEELGGRPGSLSARV